MENKMLFGVCSRIAERFGWNVNTVRLIWVLATLVYGAGVWIYLIAAVIMHFQNR